MREREREREGERERKNCPIGDTPAPGTQQQQHRLGALARDINLPSKKEEEDKFITHIDAPVCNKDRERDLTKATVVMAHC